jgi:hypothetical protein
MVVRTLAFMVIRRVFDLVGVDPWPDAKDVEIAVLRHQLVGLEYSVQPSEVQFYASSSPARPPCSWP